MVPEYVDHLLSRCTPVTATIHKQRNDRVVSTVHWKWFNQSVSCNYWDHIPTAVVENSLFAAIQSLLLQTTCI